MKRSGGILRAAHSAAWRSLAHPFRRQVPHPGLVLALGRLPGLASGLALAPALFLVLALAAPAQAWSRDSTYACDEDEDRGVLCRGLRPDGSPASGVPVAVVDGGGELLASGRMDHNGEYSFARPEGDFRVTFRPDEDHPRTLGGVGRI